MKTLLLSLLLLIIQIGFSQETPVGIFQNSADIGKPKIAGATVFDEVTQTYSMKGSGYNIWFNRDEFQFAYKKLSGDFILTANFELLNKGTDGHRKIGWMVRENLNDDAAHVSGALHGDGMVALQWRKLRGAFMRDPEDEIISQKKNSRIIQLERVGKKFIMRIANDGEPLQVLGSYEANDLPNNVFVGLFICAHNAEQIEQVNIWNVRIDRPVPENYSTSKDGWLGCRLEVMNVFEGKRKVIHTSKGRFEAPNWMPDGKKLLFNENGSLYKIPIEGGTPELLNTDAIKRNNNDHVISFDGKMLGISSHRDGLPGGGSTVYILPLEGGIPRLLTEKTPSYLHGWNPNGKELVYVGQRETKAFNIYKMAVNGGPEIALTNNPTGVTDGPEFSPDGKYIYYNSNVTGTMQIWRMKPDGTDKEQLTFDEYNNWFPHISPDGKWMVIISFPSEMNPDLHPSFKRVMLRLMPVNGGAPKVIAYMYGGQGTINVPSWSPDSKRIAFVSNSERAEPLSN